MEHNDNTIDSPKAEQKPVPLDCLENPHVDLSHLEEKERLSAAMSSYYLLYR